MLIRQRDFPKDLLIGDSIWRIKFVRHIRNWANDKRLLVGLACPESQTLSIKTGQTVLDRLTAFVHEFVHALEDEYGFEVDHDVLNKLDVAVARALLDNVIVRSKTAAKPTTQSPKDG